MDLDGKILSIAAPIISYSLCHIFNLSLNNGIVPYDWKLARITPLYKGKGNKNKMCNYRPISVISHVPKILEFFVKKQLVQYLNENNLLSKNQFAYMHNRFTNTALHTFVDEILFNMNNRLLTGVCQLDIRKGFDSVNHEILLHKLEKYGVLNVSLSWFQSYLSSRSQIVKVNGKISNVCTVNIGVTQGTILGPILFVIYVNDFDNFKDFTCIRYADDSFLSSTGYSPSDVELKLQNALDVAINWFNENRLLVNSSKSNTILFGTKQNIKTDKLHVKVLNECLPQVKDTKLLGVKLDCSLVFDKHVVYVFNKLSTKIGVLYRMSKCLAKDILNTIYLTIVQPDIDYCLSLWGNSADVYINRIQLMQNREARIVIGIYDWNMSVSKLIKDLGWMNLKTRHDYFILLIMYKCIKTGEPTYLGPVA